MFDPYFTIHNLLIIFNHNLSTRNLLLKLLLQSHHSHGEYTNIQNTQYKFLKLLKTKNEFNSVSLVTHYAVTFERR